MEERRGVWAAVAAGLLALGLIGASSILARAMVRTRSQAEVIRVTGSARRAIKSDLAIWKGTVGEQSTTQSDAYKAVTADMAKVHAYLLTQGVKADEIETEAVQTKTLYAKQPNNQGGDDAATFRQIAGYELSQDIQVKSSDVDRVDRIARTSTELIAKGVGFASQDPAYLYTKLGDLKVTMLAEAARDARERALQITQSSGSRLGDVRFAQMGVIQITPLNSTAHDFSDEGANDTTAIDKEITAIVKAGFAVR